MEDNMPFPQNEEETIALFKLAQHQLGWRIVHLQTRFPDAVIENGHGQRLIVEFEYRATNFLTHGHCPIGCDLIIAYENDWENSPVPVWELKTCTKEIVSILRKVIGYSIPFEQYLEVCGRCDILEDKIRDLTTELEKSKREMSIKIKQPQELEAFPKQDWVTCLACVGLGIGLWAIHPLVFNLLNV